MKTKTRNTIAAICMIGLCVIGIANRNRGFHPDKEMVAAAERLYPVLADFDFDGIEIRESEEQFLLYRRELENAQSSFLVNKEVASLSVDKSLIADTQSFKNIMKYCGGVFFAASLNWDGEWSGFCLYPSEPSLIPEQYILYHEDERLYWLSEIPDHIVN